MEIVNGFSVTQWLTLQQIRDLLREGEIRIDGPTGTIRLMISFIDRAAAYRFAEK